MLRFRDAASGLVQAAPSLYVPLACAESGHPATLGTLPLVVLNTWSSAPRTYRQVANDCGEVARLVGSAIVGTSAPACPPPGGGRTCQLVIDATVDGQRTAPVTVLVYTASYL